MAKKKKKNKDSYWGDLSDQQKTADDFYAYETEGVPLPGLNKKDDSDDVDLDIDTQLGKLMGFDEPEEDPVKDLRQHLLLQTAVVEDSREYTDENGVKAIDIGDYLKDIDDGKLDDEILTAVHVNETTDEFTKRVSGDENLPDTSLPLIGLRTFSISVLPEIGRYIINDGIAPSSYVENSLTHVELEVEFEETDEDVEEANNFANDMIEYLFTLKHPTAIYTLEEFAKRFASVKSYSTVRYVLMMDDTYVYAYVVDADTVSNLHQSILYRHEDLDGVISVYAGLVLAAGRSDQVFLINDEDYVEMFYKSPYNQKYAFECTFKKDDNTYTYTAEETPRSDDYDLITGLLQCENIDTVQKNARDQIKIYVGKVTLEEEYDIEFGDESNKAEESTETESQSTSTEIEPQLTKIEKTADNIADKLEQINEEVEKIVQNSEPKPNALDRVMEEIEAEKAEDMNLEDGEDTFDPVVQTSSVESNESTESEKKQDTHKIVEASSSSGITIPVIRKKGKR